VGQNDIEQKLKIKKLNELRQSLYQRCLGYTREFLPI